MNYTEFVSSHPTNTDTSITLTKQYSITNLEIAFNCCLDNLLIEYDNS